MNILLISKTPIIKQIFNLISSKLNISLTILDVNIVSSQFDIIVIEDILYDEQFPIKTYAKRFGVIAKDDLLFKGKQDFILHKPFLPSVLLSVLNSQISIISENINEEKKVDIDIDVEVEQEIEQSEDFISSLVEDISSELLDESAEEDESIVSFTKPNSCGILDKNELSKINTMLSDADTNEHAEYEEPSENDEWIDLANIIDQAIDEVKEYEFKHKEPIRLILNNYTMNELSGLLNKLDQSIIDSLVAGEEITLKLKVEK